MLLCYTLICAAGYSTEARPRPPSQLVPAEAHPESHQVPAIAQGTGRCTYIHVNER